MLGSLCNPGISLCAFFPLLRHFSFSFHVCYLEPWREAFILPILFQSLQPKAEQGSAPKTILVIVVSAFVLSLGWYAQRSCELVSRIQDFCSFDNIAGFLSTSLCIPTLELTMDIVYLKKYV